MDKTATGRIVAGTVALAAMLPYLTIKILWLTGSYVGVLRPDLFESAEMVGANAATFGMEAVGLVLAAGMIMRWGMRLPAWTVLLPLWVGTGLLSSIALSMPLVLLVSGPSAFTSSDVLAVWVYPVVYGGFVVQGVALAVAFAFYARDRWPWVFAGRYGPARHPLQLVIARGALLMCVLLGLARLALAVTADATLGMRIPQVVAGLLTIGGGVAYLALAEGRRGVPYLVTAWLGAGSTFGWGLYSVVLLAVGGPLGGGRSPLDVVEVFATLTGLVMGVAGAFLLTSGGRVVQAAQHPLEAEDREGDRQTADSGHH
ncbi:hypothetical protein [Thermoactinospora rubra]|uniref:hypothetical protein n=1 Tax=Thermoactinospora rubra TaxID=1088767 RepID=UPI00117E316E|nr:hypothetical protein [Thermoactinospora rubra]